MAAVQLQKASGSGRTIVCVYECGEQADVVHSLADQLESGGRILTVETELISSANLQQAYNEFRDLLNEQKVRQAVFVGFGAPCSLLQRLALEHFKMVRSLIFVDATTRPHSTGVERLIDWLEQFLPLGLPFRVRGKGFYAKPFLQRIRCPVLILVRKGASAYEVSESDVLAQLLPTAWKLPWSDWPKTETVLREIARFQSIPVKCPQKNLRKSA